MISFISLIIGIIIGWSSSLLFKKQESQEIEDQWNYK